MFSYGGCQGNANNFERMEDCQRRCESSLARGKSHRVILETSRLRNFLLIFGYFDLFIKFEFECPPQFVGGMLISEFAFELHGFEFASVRASDECNLFELPRSLYGCSMRLRRILRERVLLL